MFVCCVIVYGGPKVQSHRWGVGVGALTLPFLWLRAAGMNWYCRWVTLSLGEGAVMNSCLPPFTSIQGMRSALHWLLSSLTVVTSPFTSKSSSICCIQMVPVKQSTGLRSVSHTVQWGHASSSLCPLCPHFSLIIFTIHTAANHLTPCSLLKSQKTGTFIWKCCSH